MQASPGIDTTSYIQDGLVAMYDGIDNAGRGVHDPNASAWVDLAGEQDMALHNGDVYFTDYGLALPKDGIIYGVADAADPLSSINGANTTVELAGHVSDVVRSDSGSGIFWTTPVPSGGGYVLAPFAARFAASDIVIATAVDQYYKIQSLLHSTSI